MRLIGNWKDSWKWLSQQMLVTIGGVNAIAMAAVPFTPYAMKVVAGASLAAAIVGAVGRVVDQGPKEMPPDMSEM